MTMGTKRIFACLLLGATTAFVLLFACNAQMEGPTEESPMSELKSIVSEGFLSFDDPALVVHYGIDFSSQSVTTAKSTVNYGVTDSQMWVNNNGRITIIDLPLDSELSYDVTASMSDCRETHSLFVDSTVMLFHQDTFFCSCAWSEESPCPALLEANLGNDISDGTTYANYIISGNTQVSILDVEPVTGPAVIAYSEVSEASSNPALGCAPLLNADDMEGAFCITLRGGCYFQTKYENCKAAGAIGAIVINREDVFIDMTSKFSVDMKHNCA